MGTSVTHYRSSGNILRSNNTRRRALIALTVSLLVASLWYIPPLYVKNNEKKFSWNKIEAYSGLIWHDCDGGFQCSKLSVPLNYSNPEGIKASIALIRYPATVPATNPKYRGPVLINPGGPGGSGVQVVRERGALLGKVLGEEFDILGFDPRGVGISTPQAVFYSTPAERASWSWGYLYSLNSSRYAIPQVLAHDKVMNTMAGVLDRRTEGGVLAHINTDHTARDMLSIVKAHGREKILYWGFSYGTILGATFATMFPNNIERLILDGVMLAEDYYSGDWLTNLMDTSKVFDSFLNGCAAVGRDRCAFWASTVDNIRTKWTTLLERVRSDPIPVYIPSPPSDNSHHSCGSHSNISLRSIENEAKYGILDSSVLRSVMFMSFYTPYNAFQPLAKALEALYSQNDPTPLYLLYGKYGKAPFKCPVTCNDGDNSDELEEDTEAPIAIKCQDSAPIPGTLEDTLLFAKKMANVNADWWDMWSRIRISCSGYPDLPKDHFRGPVGTNTSHPILIIGNTADPVTPLATAKQTSHLFPGSVVLTQDSAGHCSPTVPSLCTVFHVRAYFVNGTLPKAGTVCPVEAELFPPLSGSPSPDMLKANQNTNVLKDDEAVLLDTAKALSRMIWEKMDRNRFLPLGII